MHTNDTTSPEAVASLEALAAHANREASATAPKSLRVPVAAVKVGDTLRNVGTIDQAPTGTVVASRRLQGGPDKGLVAMQVHTAAGPMVECRLDPADEVVVVREAPTPAAEVASTVGLVARYAMPGSAVAEARDKAAHAAANEGAVAAMRAAVGIARAEADEQARHVVAVYLLRAWNGHGTVAAVADAAIDARRYCEAQLLSVARNVGNKSTSPEANRMEEMQVEAWADACGASGLLGRALAYLDEQVTGRPAT